MRRALLRARAFATAATPSFGLGANARKGKQALELEMLRLVDVNGKQLGLMPPQEALKLAAQNSQVLTEVAAKASPPVWRLLDQKIQEIKDDDSDTHHDQDKDNAKTAAAMNIARRSQLGKKPKLKDVRFTDRCSDHDLKVKIEQIKKFLGKGYNVRVFAGVTPDSGGRGKAEKLVEYLIEGTRESGKSNGMASSGTVVSTVLEPKL